jgi:drug/metabolite transporter (DMT)-like permease
LPGPGVIHISAHQVQAGVFLAAVLLGERLNTLAIAGTIVVLGATLLIVKYDTSY